MSTVSRRRFLQATGAAGAAGVLVDAPGAVAAPVDSKVGSAVVEFRQGTNVSAAMSPGRDRLIVEVQGILWGLDARGGDATQLTPWDLEPARPDWSPTGTAVAFEAYRGGNFHVWTMAPDGSHLRRWTDGPWDHREPAWSPDGTRIAFGSDRAVGASIDPGSYDIWVLDVRSGALTQVSSGPGDDYEPTWSPDGSRVLFVRNRTTVMSVDAAGGGTPTPVATVDTGLIERPAVSPAGSLAYVHVRGLEGGLSPVGHSSVLVVDGRDATAGEDVFAVRLQWLSRSEILYTADGVVRVRNVTSGAVREIPFAAALRVQRDRYRTKDHRLTSSATERVQGVAFPRLSPDGRRVAFIALNAVWLLPVTGGRPRKLVEAAPQFLIQSLNWSRDGRYLLYSVDKDGLPAIYQRDVATGAERRLTSAAGAQVHPALSPDGRTVAVNNEAPALLVFDVATGAMRQLAIPLAGPELLGPPSWSPDGRFIAFNDRQQINSRFREGYNIIRVVEVATGASEIYPPAAHRSISDRGDCGPAWSPNGRWMAFIMESALWVIPVAPNGAPTGPARMLTDEPADSPSWSGDSQTLLYLSNGRLRLIGLSGRHRRTIHHQLTWRRSVRRDRTIRIHAGLLWDGTGETVRENVDLIIDGARIRSITPHRGGAGPGEEYIEAGDKTVVPGLWDTHNHPFEQPGYGGRYMSEYLAYGITSNVSMGGLAYPSKKEQESLAAGRRRGPRFFSTGELIEADRVSHPPVRSHATLDGVRRTLARARAMDWDFVKTYVRTPGTWMALAARFGHFVLGVPAGSHLVSPGFEAGQDMTTHLQATERLPYGHAVSATTRAYQDVYEIYTNGGFHLIETPFRAQVLLGDDPGLAADPRVQRLMPPWERAIVVARSQQPPTDVQLDALRREITICANILHRGGTVLAGSDTPLVPAGISLHLALRAFRRYGFTAAEALRTATALPARVWGVDRELGTVEPGKVADLAFVQGNPFANFDDLVNVTHVMKGGVLISTADIVASHVPGANAKTGD